MSTNNLLRSAEKALEVQEGSLLDVIVSQTNLKPGDDGYDIAKRGVGAFIAELVAEAQTQTRVNKNIVDRMISEIDTQIGRQVDEIIHSETFQKVEAAWRSLKLLVDRTDFTQNIRVEMLNASKEDLFEDFEDAPDVTRSGLYKTVYTAEYGQFGGKPYGAIIGNYELGPGAFDMQIMKNLASMAAMSHAPFFAAAHATFFGLSDYGSLPDIKELSATFEGPQYAKWRAFRETEEARYVGLVLPRFLLRTPYDPEENPVKGFNYQESVAGQHDNYLWGNAAFALASRLTHSFARYRWCPNIVGPQSGGAVDDLPVHLFESMGDIEAKIPTEVLISDRREFELSEEGFIPLTMRKGSDNAAFFSANSVQRPKTFGNSDEGKRQEFNYRLSTQLPYMFIINRLAHYLKVLQRENIGSWKDEKQLQTELNTWISGYVADQENPSSEVRGRRPLRAASIDVSEVAGQPGIYRVEMQVRPHFKYMGADFELSLVGKLEKV